VGIAEIHILVLLGTERINDHLKFLKYVSSVLIRLSVHTLARVQCLFFRFYITLCWKSIGGKRDFYTILFVNDNKINHYC